MNRAFLNRMGRVALHEYTRHVLNRRFLFGLLSVPFIIVLMVGLILILLAMDTNTTPIGYVDASGLLADPVPAPPPEAPDKPVPMLPFASEAQAQAALEAGEIQAYYLIPQDYLSSGQAKVIVATELKRPARQQFNNFLAANLLAPWPAAVAERLADGSQITVESVDGSRQMNNDAWFNILLPFFFGIAFVIAIFSSGGYMLQAVVEEKENRTMEVIITSISPGQFMSGKIIGDIAIGLTQILGWSAFVVLGILIGRNYASFLQHISLPWGLLGLTVLLMLPAFVMIGAIMATIGASVTEASEGQQVMGIVTLPIWIPYMLLVVLMESPNGPLAVGLSLFPLTAPLTMIIRAGFTILPTWQIAASLVILIVSAIGATWLAGRAFRLGMLRYGQRLAWRELFARQGAGQ